MQPIVRRTVDGLLELFPILVRDLIAAVADLLGIGHIKGFSQLCEGPIGGEAKGGIRSAVSRRGPNSMVLRSRGADIRNRERANT